MNELQALVSAILNTNVPQVRALLRAAPGVVHLHTGLHQTPLELAKDEGHTVIETALVRHLGAAHGYSGTELQRLLVDYLHDVSYDYFAAGWMDGLEFEVWALMQGDPLGPTAAFWHACVEAEQLADLAFLARHTGGWATWPAGAATPRPVPLPEWEALYHAWQVADRLA